MPECQGAKVLAAPELEVPVERRRVASAFRRKCRRRRDHRRAPSSTCAILRVSLNNLAAPHLTAAVCTTED